MGFRASVAKWASEYPSLKGFVRNLPDGRVEIVVQGLEAEVQALLNRAAHGPSSAQVTQFEVKDEPLEAQLSHFSVQRQ